MFEQMGVELARQLIENAANEELAKKGSPLSVGLSDPSELPIPGQYL